MSEVIFVHTLAVAPPHLHQVGMVVFSNMTAGDCGGGPKQHLVNGKDHGGGVELAWVVDNRPGWWRPRSAGNRHGW